MTQTPTTAHLIRFTKRMPIEIPQMTPVTLLRKACAHYNQLNPHKRPADPLQVDADPAFFARIQVNYLRHGTTLYDQNRDALRKLAGNTAARNQIGGIIKARTLAKIAATYPHLAGEAHRQAMHTDRADTHRRDRQ